MCAAWCVECAGSARAVSVPTSSDPQFAVQSHYRNSCWSPPRYHRVRIISDKWPCEPDNKKQLEAAAGPRLHFTAGNGCPRTVHALAPPPRQPPARQVGRRTEEGENVNNNVQWTRTVLNTHSLQYIFRAPIVIVMFVQFITLFLVNHWQFLQIEHWRVFK